MLLDWGDPTLVEIVSIFWFNGNQRKSRFLIEVSADGQNWEHAYSGTSSGALLGWEDYLLNREHCLRFLRILWYGNDYATQGSKNSIVEIEAWGYERVAEPCVSE